MKRKCSLCGEYKEEIEFRYMNKQRRFNAYCKVRNGITDIMLEKKRGSEK